MLLKCTTPNLVLMITVKSGEHNTLIYLICIQLKFGRGGISVKLRTPNMVPPITVNSEEHNT